MVVKRNADECKSGEGGGSFVVEERDCKEMLWVGMVQRQGGQKRSRLVARGQWPSFFDLPSDDEIRWFTTHSHIVNMSNLVYGNLLGGMDAFWQFPLRIPVQII